MTLKPNHFVFLVQNAEEHAELVSFARYRAERQAIDLLGMPQVDLKPRVQLWWRLRLGAGIAINDPSEVVSARSGKFPQGSEILVAPVHLEFAEGQAFGVGQKTGAWRDFDPDITPLDGGVGRCSPEVGASEYDCRSPGKRAKRCPCARGKGGGGLMRTGG
ncbi:MAG: hypothetical protein RLZZ399_2140 [Verrucomicrobiota bacterium]|jgi:hypothetical protein